MALSNQEILDAIAAKSVLEISELIKMMEEKFGVSAAAAAVAVAAPAAQPLRLPKSRPSSTSSSPKSARTR
jgi:ribosomal protein L7/L12